MYWHYTEIRSSVGAASHCRRSKQSFNIEGEVELSYDWEEKVFTLQLMRKSKRQLRLADGELEAKSITVLKGERMGKSMSYILHFAELIGMATHGRSGFVHVLMGSISEDVVNHSKKPVLTFVTK